MKDVAKMKTLYKELPNVVADPTIIECDEHVILWGKMFDCNRVIIGLDLGVGGLF